MESPAADAHEFGGAGAIAAHFEKRLAEQPPFVLLDRQLVGGGNARSARRGGQGTPVLRVEIVLGDASSPARDDYVFAEVPQFPYVARPGIGSQGTEGPGLINDAAGSRSPRRTAW